jgi:N6-adenosine-specific RNA methylase IME4
MTYEKIAQIPVDDWAAKDAILLLWGTWPKADQAHDTMRAWGFSHVTGFPWVKVSPSTGNIKRGVGFWTMGTSEFVLIGRRGKPKAERLKPNVLGLLCGDDRAFYGPRARDGGHSNKPYLLHDYAEDKLVGPYLELFAREGRAGWTCWGHHLGQHVYEEGVISIEEAIAKGLVSPDAAGVPLVDLPTASPDLNALSDEALGF